MGSTSLKLTSFAVTNVQLVGDGDIGVDAWNGLWSRRG